MKTLISQLMAVILLLAALTPPTANAQLACDSIFEEGPDGKFFAELTKQTSVTESQILKAVEKDLLGDRTLSQKSRDWALSFFREFNMNRNYRAQIQKEIQYRDYKTALNRMGIETKVDPLYVLKRNKHYINLAFSFALNTTVNYFSMHYLNTPVLVSIPGIKLFHPEKIPDGVLEELLTRPDAGIRTREYFRQRFQHGTEFALQRTLSIFSISVIAYLLIFYNKAVMDPTGYMLDQMNKTGDSLIVITYELNLETLRALEAKKVSFEQSGQLENITKADALIMSIKNQNAGLLEEIKKQQN